jgi:hypothetical protein
MNSATSKLFVGWGAFTAVLFCVLFMCGCRTPNADQVAEEPSAQEIFDLQRQAILAVVEKMNAATIHFTNSCNELMKHPTFKTVVITGIGPVFQKYADELARVDISSCPEDFRVAYANYYMAVLSMKSFSDANTGWRQVMKGVAAFFTLNIKTATTVPDNTDKAFSPMEKAQHALVVVLAKYNI